MSVSMFAEALEPVLSRHCTPQKVREIEAGRQCAELGDVIRGTGFLDLMVAESEGGGGAGWPELYEVASLLGHCAMPLPVAQTMLARSLLGTGAVAHGFVTFASSLTRTADGRVLAPYLAFARSASHVLGELDGQAVLLDAAHACDLQDEMRGSLAATPVWDADQCRAIDMRAPASILRPLAALVTAGLMAGAMKRVLDLSIRFANERTQFGKPIGKFQAIQQQLSVAAEHVVAARAAAEAGFSVDEGTPDLAACAVAKARTSEAAQLVSAIAHAVHGAMGVTEEYDLQLYTRRLHEWRVAYGSEAYWHRVLGAMYIEGGDRSFPDFVRTRAAASA